MSLKSNAGSLPLVSQSNLPAEITSRCKQCEAIFTISISEKQFFLQKVMSTSARCARCRRLNWSRAPNKPGGNILKGSPESRTWEALTPSWNQDGGLKPEASKNEWRLLLLSLVKKKCSSFVWNSQGAVFYTHRSERLWFADCRHIFYFSKKKRQVKRKKQLAQIIKTRNTAYI